MLAEHLPNVQRNVRNVRNVDGVFSRGMGVFGVALLSRERFDPALSPSAELSKGA